jgi:acetyl esterase
MPFMIRETPSFTKEDPKLPEALILTTQKNSMHTDTNAHIDLLRNHEFKQFIDAFISISKTAEQLPLPEVRKLSTQFFLPTDTVYEPVHRIENLEILGKDHNQIPLRIFIPNDSKRLPVLMFFHRGGWVFGNIEEADPICRKLANHLGCLVVAVDYRLAPENPFPKPLDDCYEATEWIANNASNFGGDHSKLMVGGESAGGNLAAAVALMARDRQGPSLSAQVLIYPVICSDIKDNAYDHCVDSYFLTKDSMKFFWSMYIQSPEQCKNKYASPDHAIDFSNLPPALIITAEYDPLYHEANDYANKLKQAGVQVISKCFPKVIYGFIDLPIYKENQKVRWISEIGNLLKQLTRH